MAIKIEMLRCFATVAQTGNLAEAAERLGRTQSAVSMTLKQLEGNLGKRLFNSDRKNRLTPLGEHVFELAQTQLQQFDYTVKAIETSAKSPKGLVRVVSIPSVAGIVFPSLTQTLIRRHSGLSLELRDTDTGQAIDALLRGQADVGIVSGIHKLNGVKQAPLFSDYFGLICSPDHPLAHQKSRPTIEQVATVDLIRNNLCSMIESPSIQEAFENAKVSIHNTMSLIAMVRNGSWVTILPRSVVQFMAPDLVFRRISGLKERRQVSALLREKTPFPQFSEEFWQLLTEFDWDEVTNAQNSGFPSRAQL